MCASDLEALARMPTAAESEPPGAFADDPESLPPGSVVGPNSPAADRIDEVDFIVVGSGAAGAVAAFVLADAGFRVAIVEEGPWVRTREFGAEVYPAFKRMYRSAGAAFTVGRSVLPLLQGVCVGGSTTINSAIGWRLPEDIIDDWTRHYGLGAVMQPAALERCFDRLERDLKMQPVSDAVLGRNNSLLRDGMRAQGIEPHTIARYENGCRGAGRCGQGCPNGAKLSMALSYVPWALRKGARIMTQARVDRVLVRGGSAVGVEATVGRNRKLKLRASYGVVVAASTVQTPNLLRRSGLRARAIGRNFSAHPGVGLGALYDDAVHMHRGATQGMESTHFRRSDRFKLEAVGLSPELTAVRVPGVGAEFMRRLAGYDRLAVWGVQVRAHALGRVTAMGRDDVVHYSLTSEDVRIGKKGLRKLAEIAFATGAREVYMGVYGLPDALRSADELRMLDRIPDEPQRMMFIATHLFGAARMGPDPRSSAVGLDFATHEVPNLFVVDSSTFPTNLGINPQHTIMALAMLAAERIAEQASSRTLRTRLCA